MSLRFREIKTGHVDLTNISVIEERTWSSLGEVSNGHLAWLRDLQRLLAFLLSILEHPCYCVGIAVADGSTKNTITSVNKLSLSQVYLCRLIHTQVRDVSSRFKKKTLVNGSGRNKCQGPESLYLNRRYFRDKKPTMI